MQTNTNKQALYRFYVGYSADARTPPSIQWWYWNLLCILPISIQWWSYQLITFKTFILMLALLHCTFYEQTVMNAQWVLNENKEKQNTHIKWDSVQRTRWMLWKKLSPVINCPDRWDLFRYCVYATNLILFQNIPFILTHSHIKSKTKRRIKSHDCQKNHYKNGIQVCVRVCVPHHLIFTSSYSHTYINTFWKRMLQTQKLHV